MKISKSFSIILSIPPYLFLLILYIHTLIASIEFGHIPIPPNDKQAYEYFNGYFYNIELPLCIICFYIIFIIVIISIIDYLSYNIKFKLYELYYIIPYLIFIIILFIDPFRQLDWFFD